MKKLIVTNECLTKHQWEYDDWMGLSDYDDVNDDQVGSKSKFNKSTLIYRLMRSRLEANLAKSISGNKALARTKQQQQYVLQQERW